MMAVVILVMASSLEPSFAVDFNSGKLPENVEVQVSAKFAEQLKSRPVFVRDRFGDALDCGGWLQYGHFVKVASPPFQKDTPFTISCWFKPREGAWLVPLFYYMPFWEGPQGFAVLQNGSRLGLQVGKKCIIESDEANPIQKNTWYFLAVGWNGKEWKMFLNGTEFTARENPPFVPLSASAPLNIGGYNTSTNNIFQGLIDEVEFFPKELSSDDLFRLMSSKLERYEGIDAKRGGTM